MALKRHFDNEIPCEVSNGVSFKRQRVEESGDQISLNTNGVSSMADDEGYYGLGDGQMGNNYYRECVEDEAQNVLPRFLSLSPCASQSSSDDEDTVDVAMDLPFVPEYFSFDRPIRPFRHIEYDLLDYPPRKQIPIGPEHQAEIPDLLSHGGEGTHDDDNIHLTGTCIIPFHESELPVHNRDQVGDGRTDCNCWDRGSFRCVRQHVDEVRENVRRSLGPLAFSELGFNDMGEVVARKWSEDEENVFHEVVLSNPASLGKKFWNALSFVFPSRSKMEIVSYYYNVFMLRKRARQNRVDTLHVDSDNDEWQDREYADGDDEGDVTEDDEDSAVESPITHHGPLFYGSYSADNDDDADEVCDKEDDKIVLVPRRDQAITANPEFVFQPLTKASYDEAAVHDNQDGSCTSSDSGASSQEVQGNPDSCEWREFILEPCDTEVWDAYWSCNKNKVDLLPTCSVIDEVFGYGAFDLKGKRW